MNLPNVLAQKKKSGEPVHEKLAKITSNGMRALLNA